MALLGQQAGDILQGAVKAQGATVGDALNAATVQQQAEASRQKLEMDKQTHEQNKFNWLSQQLDQIRQQPQGHIRNLLIDGFQKQAPQVIPGYQGDVMEAAKRDDDTIAGASAAMEHVQNGKMQPGDFNKIFSAGTDNQIKTFQGILQQKALVEAAQFKAQQAAGITDVRQQMVDQGTHKSAIADIDNDKTTVGLQNGFNSIKTATENFKAEKTPQAFHELQQALRSNMGIMNRSGVAERGDTYLNSIGLKGQDLDQFLSADPQDVNKLSPKLVENIMGGVDKELHMKQQQALQNIDQRSLAHMNSFYMKPGKEAFKQDFLNAVQSKKDIFNLPEEPQAGPTGGASDLAAKQKRLQELRAKAAGG